MQQFRVILMFEFLCPDNRLLGTINNSTVHHGCSPLGIDPMHMMMKDDSKSKTAVLFEDTFWDGCVICDGKSIEVNAAWRGGRKQVVFFYQNGT